MKALRQMGSGFIIGILSLLLVIGGISLSLAETSAPALPPTPSPIPTDFAVEFASPFPSPTVELIPILPTDTLIPSPTTEVQVATNCVFPANWITVTVGVNEDLYTIAQKYNTTTDELNEKNCLNFLNPAPGAIIHVPAVPTKVVAPCLPPAGWVKRHVVQKGDNLYRIALSYGITYPQLQAGNCMGSSVTIFAGQILWAPNIPTFTPFVTATATNTVNYSTPTNTATNTPDYSTVTATFMVTASPIPATQTPSITPLPTIQAQ
ncbi:MAG: LysM peptidoglycan-binding domain-containing protein [Anaerolineales bacterium]|nr:LysM peptidoglycan-binding domain-containing protein [Anaerolineales bacterium]